MKRSIVGLLMLACLAMPAASLAEDGSAGLPFLKLGVGARAIAMGDAYVAVGGDASCVYWNPAGCASVVGTDIVAMHSEWFQDIRYEYVGAVRTMCDHSFGIGVVGLYMDDLEKRDIYGDYEGTFGVFDFSVTGTYARSLTEYLDVGASAKYLHEKIDDETASGFAVDLGAMYRVPAVNGLTAGMSVQNLGPQMSFVDEKFDLPALYRVGAAYEKPVEAAHGVLLLTGDAVLSHDGDPKGHFGMEFDYSEMLSLRIGYRAGWDNQNISVGLGARVGDLRIDYAYVPFYSNLGDTHRVSLGYSL